MLTIKFWIVFFFNTTLINCLHLDVTMESDDQMSSAPDPEPVTEMLPPDDKVAESSRELLASDGTEQPIEISPSENKKNISADQLDVDNKVKDQLEESTFITREEIQQDDITDKFNSDASELESSLNREEPCTSSEESSVVETENDSMPSNAITAQQSEDGTLVSEGDDLLTELDKELSVDNCVCENSHPNLTDPPVETARDRNTSVDLIRLPPYSELKEQNEELVKEQVYMRLEIER